MNNISFRSLSNTTANAIFWGCHILSKTPSVVSSLGSQAMKVLAEVDPSVAKIVMGTGLSLYGGVVVAKSNILEKPLSWITGKQDDPATTVDYKLAVAGGVLLGGGVTMVGLGASELYDRYTGTSSNQETSQKQQSKRAVPIPKEHNLCLHPEGKELCSKNLGIPRGPMPQLEGQVKEDFLAAHSVKYTKVDAGELHATQGELDARIVNGMVGSAKEGKYNPCKDMILIANSTDYPYMILDGHHRAAACHQLKGEISVAVFDQNIQDLLDIANNFEGVEHIDIYQGPIL